jgi:hypothetical protein
MNKLLTYAAMALVVVMVFSGCKSNKEATADRSVPSRKTDEILAMMKKQEFACDWVNLKYDVEIDAPEFEDSFKMYVRLKQDSAIWVSATYYAVEVARFLFLPDTVKFMDRKNNQFYIGEYDYIKDRFDVDLSFEVLESLILSNSVKLLEMEAEEGKIRSSKEDGSYFLTFLRKGQLRRALRGEGERLGVDLNIGLWVNPEGFRLEKTSIDDFESERTLTAEYTDYKEVCNSSFPYVTDYTLQTANEQVKVKTSVMKLATGKELSLSFTIPDKYEALVP